MSKLPKIEIDPEEMARLGLELWERLKSQEPTDKGDEGLTTGEYAELWGVPINTAKERLRKMRNGGLMIRGKAYRKTKKDYWARFPVYRPKEEE